MKIKYLFLLLFVPIVYTACKKDDEDNTNSNNSLNNTSSVIGAWEANFIEYITTRGYYEDYPNGKVVLETETETWTNNNQLNEVVSCYVDFKDNGECIITLIGSNGEIEIDTNNYMKQGDLLIFLSDDNPNDGENEFLEEGTHNIETLNNSTLRLNMTAIDTGSFSGPTPVQDVLYFTEGVMNCTFNRDN